MRIYLFEHKGTHFFVLASTEPQARAMLAHDSSRDTADQAVYVNSSMSYAAAVQGNGEPWVNVWSL